jgi:hypothetical protein
MCKQSERKLKISGSDTIFKWRHFLSNKSSQIALHVEQVETNGAILVHRVCLKPCPQEDLNLTTW